MSTEVERIGSLGLYAGVAIGLTVAVVLGGWPLLAGTGRVALLATAAIALLVQVATFGALTAVPIGTNYFLAVWFGGTVMRVSVIAAAAFLFAGIESVDTAVTVIALAVLFMVLMALELWVIIRDRAKA